jgi:cell cycle arrest protein BUB3
MELALSNPRAGTSNVTFSGTGETILVSSWDSSVSLFDVGTGALQNSYQRVHTAPVLDCGFIQERRAVTASADGTVKQVDLATGSDTLLSTHAQPVQCVEYCAERAVVVSAGWDKQVILADPRQPPAPSDRPNAGNITATLPDKAYTLALAGDRIVVGMAARHVYVYDVRNMAEPEQRRESSLKYQTRCIRCTPVRALTSVSARLEVACHLMTPMCTGWEWFRGRLS